MKANGGMQILTDKPFLYQNSLGQPPPAHRIPIDRYIIDQLHQLV